MANAKHPLVLVTGGSSGIGLELAKIFAAEGHDVVLASSRAARLKKAAEQVNTAGSGHGIKVATVAVDLSKTAGPKKLHDAVKDMGRPISSSIMPASGSGAISCARPNSRTNSR